MLKLAGLSRSTFYYRLKLASLADRHAVLRERIKAIFALHKGRYGYRRVTAAIRQPGQKINHKTVQRLMVEMGLKSLVRPKKYRSYRGDAGRVAPDLLKRQFQAEGPNQKWVTDITEFNVAGEKLYLSPVMDLFNGEIIAYGTARRPVFKLVEGMLNKAMERLNGKDRPILHSDQGWHYQMPAYRRRLQARGIAQSMSRDVVDRVPQLAGQASFSGSIRSTTFSNARLAIS
ncbi:IS3 family transposase (plasmid) [Sinorhizobium meliloti]|nr:IS3 family transposase [Sinorhizobium meliloti]WRQ71803.1 IS3 family transposase [Sinorhizobium meliloti]